mmetsp:Transcript_24781/g.62307  ORF Transcript_24781/g.62307 Transcript_24781/m.62307 type:complete len:205 (-) Transcript_24781:1806-2420(-)
MSLTSLDHALRIRSSNARRRPRHFVRSSTRRTFRCVRNSSWASHRVSRSCVDSSVFSCCSSEKPAMYMSHSWGFRSFWNASNSSIWSFKNLFSCSQSCVLRRSRIRPSARSASSAQWRKQTLCKSGRLPGLISTRSRYRAFSPSVRMRLRRALVTFFSSWSWARTSATAFIQCSRSTTNRFSLSSNASTIFVMRVSVSHAERSC